MKKRYSIFLAALLITVMLFSPETEAQWITKASKFSIPNRGINEMIAVSEKVAWALSYDGNAAFVNPSSEFTRTVDKGKHWIAGNIGIPDQYLVGLAPISDKVAFILSSDINFVGRVLKTTNGGITWKEQHPSPVDLFYDDIYFFNEHDGLIFTDQTDGYMTIFTTHDGGKHWTRVPQANMPAVDNPDENGYIFSVSAVGNKFWTVSTHGRVWKTSDKGLHWIANSSPVTEAEVSNIKMRDALNGLWGIEGELYRTSDGGITWTEIIPIGTFFTNDLAYVPGTASTWISTGGDVNSEYGALHGIGSSFSVDNGNTWKLIDTAVDHLALDMRSRNSGFCGGFNINSTTGGVSIFDGLPCLRERNPTELTGTNTKLSIYATKVNNAMTIYFSLSQADRVAIKIFDLKGVMVKNFMGEEFAEGQHSITWDCDGVRSGIYILSIQTPSLLETNKIIVTK